MSNFISNVKEKEFDSNLIKLTELSVLSNKTDVLLNEIDIVLVSGNKSSFILLSEELKIILDRTERLERELSII